MRKKGPRLGCPVLFTHYYDKPTTAEVEARVEELGGADGTISRVRRERPNTEVPAIVVGVCRKPMDAPLYYDDDGEGHPQWENGGHPSTFYVVKYSLRGRRYLVTLEDMDSPS